nr:glycogen/starch/alpha-glucan phosphorylase [Lachnospiraceae bacterium]
HKNDEFFVIADFMPYIKAYEELTADYKDRIKWNKSSLHNVAKSGYFSSDRTIREYADEIWKM